MGSINKLKAALAEIEYDVLVEIVDAIWYIEEDTIRWNTDNNKEGLFNQDGNSYSGWLPEGSSVADGHLICNVDTDQGYWVTKIFSKENEVAF